MLPLEPITPPPPDPSGAPNLAADPQVQLRKSLIPLPMTLDEVGEWKERIKQSEKRITDRQDEWDTLWKSYLPTPAKEGAQAPKVNAHFRNVHTKMGQLFVRSPQVLLSAKGKGRETMQQPPGIGPDGMPTPPQTLRATDGIAIRQTVINTYMGRSYINAIALMDECLLDMQAYSGFAAVEVSYRSVSRTVNQPVMGPDPNFIPPPQMPGSLGLNTPPPPQVPQLDPFTQLPKTTPIQVPIYECWEAKRIPPKKVLFDEQLKSCRIDRDSRWIGKIFYLSKRLAKRQYGLTDLEIEKTAETDDRNFADDRDQSNQPVEKDLLRGYHLWYKAEYFSDNDNPDALVELVLFDCVPDAPVVHRPSVDQTFDDQGALTEDSAEGFPIIVGSLRPTLDSPYPKSDSAFTDGDVKHLSTHRRQMVAVRDAAIGKVLMDSGAFDDADIAKIQNAEAGSTILVKSGALAAGADKLIALVAQVHSTPDDWRTAAMLKSDMEETIGISGPQAGGQNDTVRSATEVNTQNQGSQGRNEKEKFRVIDFYLQIVGAVDVRIFRYATGNRYVEVAGPTGAKKIEVWNKQIGAGKYSYDIKPDSQLVGDVARDRQQKIAGYNIMGPDPLFNRAPALRDISSSFGWDPTETVLDQATVNAQQFISNSGTPVGQPPHGGGPVNKHQAEKSGAVPNAPGAAQSGDNRQERNPRPGGGA